MSRFVSIGAGTDKDKEEIGPNISYFGLSRWGRLGVIHCRAKCERGPLLELLKEK